MVNLDAIVLATDPLSRVRVAGLPARERAKRVALAVGAVHVHVVEDEASRAQLSAWRGARTNPILIVRADQLVHMPLVAPLIKASSSNDVVIAVVPAAPPVNDLTEGAY